MLSIIMLNVVMLSVTMLSVVVPFNEVSVENKIGLLKFSKDIFRICFEVKS
jgi:hypothetical protein